MSTLSNFLGMGEPGDNGSVLSLLASGAMASATPTPLLQNLVNQQYKEENYNPNQVNYAGDYTSANMSPTELRNVLADQSLRKNEGDVLTQLKDVSQSGMTSIDRARLQEIQNQMNNQNKAANETIMQNSRQRGMGGSGNELANQLLSQQSSSNQANSMGMDVNSQAQARALQALSQLGDYSSSLENQRFGQDAQKAQAQDLINQFNTQNQNQSNLRNVDTRQQLAGANTDILNQAAQYNAQNKQAVNMGNVDLANQANYYNTVDKPMQQYGIQSGRDQMLAGGLSQAANMKNANKQAAYNANTQLIGSAIGATGSMIGGGLASGKFGSK